MLGGGVSGIAWITGLLTGLADAGEEKPLAQTIDELRAGGADVAIIEPDEASLAAIGANPLDPSTRTPAAEAGRAQGRALQLDRSTA